ncbi:MULTISPECIES: maleylacetate reductase [Pseudomonadaceae]|uniref:Maleylacetate reductase n=1 Tax=Stutzerimonas xanthomarina TaxID=271420 RepID=A0A3R8UYH8_9GAMM|nr:MULTISPECIES: maleylacetate reductase [Pseudomonadaceae]MDB1107853.1 maleylacetate reductase [Pseudomonas extremaustralis]RRV03600.1 maleylacetate reductase [Stutzerimonas xanthomarina]RZO10705.1 maleylacetate reductase [Pseudomonas moorei]WQN29912.1 maleylacetate reductase [Stutzerimonas stutzeri]
MNFNYQPHAQRVLFGSGRLASLRDELERLGRTRAVVLCTPQQAAQAFTLLNTLGSLGVGLFSEARMHVPVETVDMAQDYLHTRHADSVVAFGGGSTIGLAKALALRAGGSLPIIAVPTTYAGSEMTSIYGITENSLKTTGRDINVLPATVLYDPDLTLELPLNISLFSGVNAIAHAAEALYAEDRSPISDLMAGEGIRALVQGMPKLHLNPRNPVARGECLYGAWLCGTVLGQVTMGLHHKLCHTLGGTLDLPHAETHTIMLPHTLAYNYRAAPQAMRRIESAMGTLHAATGLYEFITTLGLPKGLREVGMQEHDIERVCDVAMAHPYRNPREIERDAIMRLLRRAWEGSTPSDI